MQGLEDQTANLALTITVLKVDGTVVAQAFRTGGWKLATVTAADELIGQTIGVNPSMPVNAVRSIANALEAQRVLAQLTRQANDDLAANPALARTVLSRAEYDSAVTSSKLAKAQWGNAVERIVRGRIADDPNLSQVFRHVGGANNPGFTAFGRNFDITTETKAQIFGHMKRPGYGNDLIIVTYERPSTFTRFPGAP